MQNVWTMYILQLNPLSDNSILMAGRKWVRKDGKLCYDVKDGESGHAKVPKAVLNSQRHSTNSNRRLIFKGYYELDIPVAIERKQLDETLIVEIEREFNILRDLDLHENFIRYFTYEYDEKENFV